MCIRDSHEHNHDKCGPQGPPGPCGKQGEQGPCGKPGGLIGYGQYVQYGSQPAPVNPGQPFTYSNAIITSPDVNSVTALFNPPFTNSGTIFILNNPGIYEVNWQMTYPMDAGTILYTGQTIATMIPQAYTMVGKTTDGQVAGSVIIQTLVPNSYVSVNAAAGNVVAITIPVNSSTANQSATTVSFKQIA